MRPLHVSGRDQEHRLLREIGDLADRVRGLRRTSAAANATQIRSLTDDLRGKWEQLRRLRAPSANTTSLQRRGHYD